MRTVPESGVPAAPCSALTPILRINFSIVDTSCSRGTLVRVTGSLLSSAAHNSGKAAFLAPEISTVPASD
jgi:hypothetical protein